MCHAVQLMRVVWPLGFALQEVIPNRLLLLWSRAMVVSEIGKVIIKMSGALKEDERK